MKFFNSVPSSIVSGGVLGGLASTIASIAFFIALDREIRSQNDASDGATRGIFSFIVGPIATYYLAGAGVVAGSIAGGLGRLGYEQIAKICRP